MASLKGNEGLRELDLSANRIDKEAAKVIARTVPHMLQLTTLRVRVEFPVFPDFTQQLPTVTVRVELQLYPDLTQQLTTVKIRVELQMFPDLTQQLTTLKVRVELQVFPDFAQQLTDNYQGKGGITSVS